MAVGDVSAGRVDRRETPKIRGLYLGMVPPVAKTIIAFEHEGDARDRPVRPLIQLVHGQCVNGAVEPLERRTAGRRAPGGNVDCSRVQRITVV